MPMRRLLPGAEMKLTPADKLWSIAVKDRDSWTCVRCGTSYIEGSRGLNAHHIFTRSRRSTRLMLLNGISLCTGCHSFAHRNPLEFHAFVAELLGADQYAELQQLSRVLKRTGAESA